MTTERGDTRAQAGHDLAGLGQRFVALFIDWIACQVTVYLLAWAIDLADPFTLNLMIALLFLAYYTFIFAVGSQSLGMGIMRIACIRADTGDRLGLGRSFIRALLLSIVLPALTAIGDKYHRGLHDHAANSVVLKVAPANPR